MKKSIICTAAFGRYHEAAKSFIESLGYNYISYDGGNEKAGFMNMESVRGLNPGMFAIIACGDIDYFNMLKYKDDLPNPVFTYINDVNTFCDKVKCRDNLPVEKGIIKYPKIYSVPNVKCVIKPRVGYGSLPSEGRRCYVSSPDDYAVEYIEHSQAQVVLARYEKGNLVEEVFYTGKPEESWAKAKPDDYVADPELPVQKIRNQITKFMFDLGYKYDIDGVIDAEFMLKDHKLYYAESNPRINGQSYYVAQKLFTNYLRQKLPESFWTEELRNF